MDAFFFFIADIFKILFNFMEKVGDISNNFIAIMITVATIYWIRYMVKVEGNESKNYLSRK
jgi:hypothetical protein